MQYLPFPALDVGLSRLILGTVALPSFTPALTDELLMAWLEVGGNVFDCALHYGDGESERILGRWLQERGMRDDVVIVTKGGHPIADRRRVTPEDIASDLMESLDHLRTGTIDLYLLHRDDPTVPVGPIVEALDEHRRAGRIRAFGASNWTCRRMDEANAYAAAHGLDGFSCGSPNLSLATQNEQAWPGALSASDPQSRAWYTLTQTPMLAWSSQGAGFFTGRYTPESRDDPDMVRVYYNDGNWERLRRAESLGREKGYTANQIALAWVLHQPFPTYAVIGPRSVEELRSSVRALEIRLTPEEIVWLNLEDEADLRSAEANSRQPVS